MNAQDVDCAMIDFVIDPDIRLAQTFPSAWYRDDGEYRRTIATAFATSCQVIGDVRITAPASGYATVEPTVFLEGSLKEPVMIVHDSGDVHVTSNVCTHRGNILVKNRCDLREIRCGYHGRRFDLQGRCGFMPEFRDVVGFPSASDHLATLHATTWAGMVVAAMPDAVVLPGEWLRDVAARCGFLPLERAIPQPHLQRDYTIGAHWALYVENYLEGFHIPFVHPGLNAALAWNAYETHLLERGVLQIGIAADGDAGLAFDLPAGHVDEGKRVAAWYFWLYPNTMINVYPWGISQNTVLPHGLGTTVVRYRTYVWAPELFDTGAGSGLDTVEHEDDAIVESVQRGMQSRLYHRGRYSPTQERGVHHFHRMMAGLPR